MFAIGGGMAAAFLWIDTFLVKLMFWNGTGRIYWPFASVLAMTVAFQMLTLWGMRPPSANHQRFIERLWRVRVSQRRVRTWQLCAMRALPAVLIIAFFTFWMLIEIGINGIQPPDVPLLALAGGLITLGLFRRTGHRITCAQCAYPWARTPNCPECGREYTDYRDLRMGTRTRSPVRIAIGLVCLAAGVVLALL